MAQYNWDGLNMGAPAVPQFNFGGMNSGAPIGNYNFNMPQNMEGFTAMGDGMPTPTPNLTPGASGFKFGWNAPTMQLGLNGLNTLNSLWGAYQANEANKLAKDQFNFAKEIGNVNLNNQIKSYNTALGDRARTRAQFSAADDGNGQAYFDQNKMTR